MGWRGDFSTLVRHFLYNFIIFHIWMTVVMCVCVCVRSAITAYYRGICPPTITGKCCLYYEYISIYTKCETLLHYKRWCLCLCVCVCLWACVCVLVAFRTFVCNNNRKIIKYPPNSSIILCCSQKLQMANIFAELNQMMLLEMNLH